MKVMLLFRVGRIDSDMGGEDSTEDSLLLIEDGDRYLYLYLYQVYVRYLYYIVHDQYLYLYSVYVVIT